MKHEKSGDHGDLWSRIILQNIKYFMQKIEQTNVLTNEEKKVTTAIKSVFGNLNLYFLPYLCHKILQNFYEINDQIAEA